MPVTHPSILSLCILLIPGVMAEATEKSATASFSVTVDFGQDVGQSLGTLFEARDATGRIVAGAGFQDVYNTRFRNDRHRLQFFVRPVSGGEELTIDRLPHPDLDCGVYLFDLNEQIYAWTTEGGNSVRRWDDRSKSWKAERPPGVPDIRSGDGVTRLGTGVLVFAQNAAWYNDRQILSPPESGGYHDFYYAQGHLLFYHRLTGDGGFTHLYACPWTPQSPHQIDLSQAVVFDTPYDRETPFAWGQWQDQVVTVSNMGGIYVYENGRWTVQLAPDDKVSYQVYSALHWHDRLLLAQYPTGNVFEYRGSAVTQMKNWPPVSPGVATSARECQTLSIYRGDLMAGVWPWAELWRRDHDAKKWHSMGRMFTHPESTAKTQHPYETEAKDLGLVLNHWGQRVTSMIPHGDSLFMSTSAKGTVPWKDEYTFLTDEQRREYGAVLRLRIPGNLAAQINWPDRPARFTFSIEPGRLIIHQDGDILGSSELPQDFNVDWSGISTQWGHGTYGPVRGELSQQTLVTPLE
ncbi:MAG: hypothetical protein ABGZ35_12485 [Planctomycetaceae bacterium]